ncbi:MAG: hypothetical protein R3F65_33035 [bacterium]
MVEGVTPVATEVSGWLAEAAEALDGRLRGGEGDREGRKAGRRLLRRAFDALEAGEADLALVRAVDAAARTPWAGPSPCRIGVPPLETHPDPVWLAQLWAVAVLTDAIADRTERMLASLRDPEVRRFATAVVSRAGDEPEMTLTDG